MTSSPIASVGSKSAKPPEVAESPRLLLSFGAAAILTAATVPAAIRIARGTGFLDNPAGYKAHAQPDSLPGRPRGARRLALPADPDFRAGLGRYWPLLLGTFGLALVGTVDDRVNLSPWLRMAAEVLAAWLLWRKGLGWSVGGNRRQPRADGVLGGRDRQRLQPDGQPRRGGRQRCRSLGARPRSAGRHRR